MALRIRSRWHEDGPARSAAEIGGLLAANSWKIATERAVNLHIKGCHYQDDQQRLEVIGEFLTFQTMVIDRIIYHRIDKEQRGKVITELVLKSANHMTENGTNMIGDGDYQTPFIENFNRRAGEYAECQFQVDEMNYPFMRCFGSEVQRIMGDEIANRWVIDQVMDIDASEICQLIQKILRQMDLDFKPSTTE